MSIYVRPVREQIEHDRVIRHLQGKLKRKYDVAMNVGAEQSAASVKGPAGLLFPDLVLTANDRGRKLAGVIEVETGESVHHLEAMAQWAPFGRLRVPFHLYVPVNCADMAKRLAADLGAHITELWSYHAIGDQIRLALVQKTPLPAGKPMARVERDTPPAVKPAVKDVKEKEKKPVKEKKPAAKPAAAKAKSKAKPPSRKPARKAAKKPARPARRASAKRK